MNDRPDDERRRDDPDFTSPADDPSHQTGVERFPGTPRQTPEDAPRNLERWAADPALDSAGTVQPKARAEEPDPLERPLDEELTPLPRAFEPDVSSPSSWKAGGDDSSPYPPTSPEAAWADTAGPTHAPGVAFERLDDSTSEPAAPQDSRLIHLEHTHDHTAGPLSHLHGDDAGAAVEDGPVDNVEPAAGLSHGAMTSPTSSPGGSDDVSPQAATADFLHIEDRRGDALPPPPDVTGEDESPPAPPAEDDSGEARARGFLGSIGSAVGTAREAISGRAAGVGRDTEAGTRVETESEGTAPDNGTAPGERRVDGLLERFRGEPGDLLDPSLRAATAVPQRMVLIGGVIAIFLSLLSNNAGMALIVASAIVPVSISLALNQRDLFEKESTSAISAVGGAGLVCGVIIALVSSWIASGAWFSYGTLNYGAIGFGGRFSNLAGSPPFSVWLLNGLVLPLLGLAAIAAAPIALRRWPQFRNEVMDGVILCGTSAAGFAIGSAIVYWAPMVSGRGPQTDVADWTLSTLGVTLLRPIVITLAGAMLGAGIWKYASSPKPVALFLPLLGSVAGTLLLSLGSLQFGPSGLWPEVIWTALVAIASFMIYRLVLNGAISTDRVVVGDDGARVVCPNCHLITPAGAFCAHCGTALDHAPAPAPAPASVTWEEKSRG